ncbi:MAG: hypothetical protein HC902_13615 [Calothrix sp. SM1_5_4]|nr:hypothetical protein [Calothrix sp. SM1_5_4]
MTQLVQPISNASAAFTATKAESQVTSSVTISEASGGVFSTQNTGSGTLSMGHGIKGSVINTSTGTIADAYGGMFSVTRTSGTVTRGYGVYTGTIQGTSKWSFYASDSSTPSYFAGAVGIGVQYPVAPLDIASESGNTVRFARYSGSNGANSIQIVRGRGTLAAPATPLYGDNLGDLSFQGYSSGVGARILATASEDHAAGSASGAELRFLTTLNGSTTPTTQMRILNDGRVVIDGAIEFLGNVNQNVKDQGATGGASIDFNVATIHTSGSNCGGSPDFVLYNIKDGGNYTLVVTSSTINTCTFSFPAGMTAKWLPPNGGRIAGSDTIYNFFRAGNTIYVNWTTGYQ